MTRPVLGPAGGAGAGGGAGLRDRAGRSDGGIAMSDTLGIRLAAFVLAVVVLMATIPLGGARPSEMPPFERSVLFLLVQLVALVFALLVTGGQR